MTRRTFLALLAAAPLLGSAVRRLAPRTFFDETEEHATAFGRFVGPNETRRAVVAELVSRARASAHRKLPSGVRYEIREAASAFGERGEVFVAWYHNPYFAAETAWAPIERPYFDATMGVFVHARETT